MWEVGGGTQSGPGMRMQGANCTTVCGAQAVHPGCKAHRVLQQYCSSWPRLHAFPGHVCEVLEIGGGADDGPAQAELPCTMAASSWQQGSCRRRAKLARCRAGPGQALLTNRDGRGPQSGHQSRPTENHQRTDRPRPLPAICSMWSTAASLALRVQPEREHRCSQMHAHKHMLANAKQR